MTNSHVSKRPVLIVFFLLGAVAVVTQSLLVREFLVISFGNELSLGLTFFGWLAGVALGAAAGGRVSRKESRRLTAFVAGLTLLALLTPVEITAIRVIRSAFDVGPGEYLSLWTMLWLNPTLTVPVSFLIGFAFPLASALLANRTANGGTGIPACQPSLAPDRNVRPTTATADADPIAKVYAAEAAGSLLGGALFSFVLIEHVAPFHLVGGTGALLLIAAALLLSRHGWTSLSRVARDKKPWHVSWVAFLPAVVFLAATIFWGNALERHTIDGRWKSFRTGTEIVAPGPVDSRYQNITLARREDEYTVFLDGLAAMTFPNPTGLAPTTHFVMCQAKEVRRVLLIGGGLEGRIAEMLKHPVERLDYVALDPELLELVRGRLAEADRAALADPRLHVHYDDGRHFLIHLVREKTGPAVKYDLIYLDVPEPSSVLLNRFYTAEFFELVKKRLSENGLFAFTLTASPGYFSRTRRDYLGSIWRALGRSLSERLATWGETTVVLAAHAKGVFTTSGKELVRRYEARRVTSKHFHPLWLDGSTDMLTAGKLRKIHEEITRSDAGPNTDSHPLACLYNLILQDRIVSGRKTSAFEHLDNVNITWVLLAIAAASLLWWGISRRPLRKTATESAALFSVASTGFTGMSLELILLVTFQCLYGYVYVHVGIIIGIFMLGLVAGSLVMKRVVAGRPDLGVRTLGGFDAGIAVFAMLVPVSFLLINSLSAHAWVVEWGIAALVLISGVLGGSIFPLSANIVLREGKQTGRAAGSVDAADHVGACIGALITGVVLIPAIGITSTCLVIAVLKLLSCAFLMIARPRKAPTGRAET